MRTCGKRQHGGTKVSEKKEGEEVLLESQDLSVSCGEAKHLPVVHEVHGGMQRSSCSVWKKCHAGVGGC